jgi:hypothetical protein
MFCDFSEWIFRLSRARDGYGGRSIKGGWVVGLIYPYTNLPIYVFSLPLAIEFTMRRTFSLQEDHLTDKTRFTCGDFIEIQSRTDGIAGRISTRP